MKSTLIKIFFLLATVIFCTPYCFGYENVDAESQQLKTTPKYNKTIKPNEDYTETIKQDIPENMTAKIQNTIANSGRADLQTAHKKLNETINTKKVYSSVDINDIKTKMAQAISDDMHEQQSKNSAINTHADYYIDLRNRLQDPAKRKEVIERFRNTEAGRAIEATVKEKLVNAAPELSSKNHTNASGKKPAKTATHPHKPVSSISALLNNFLPISIAEAQSTTCVNLYYAYFAFELADTAATLLPPPADLILIIIFKIVAAALDDEIQALNCPPVEPPAGVEGLTSI